MSPIEITVSSKLLLQFITKHNAVHSTQRFCFTIGSNSKRRSRRDMRLIIFCILKSIIQIHSLIRVCLVLHFSIGNLSIIYIRTLNIYICIYIITDTKYHLISIVYLCNMHLRNHRYEIPFDFNNLSVYYCCS